MLGALIARQWADHDIDGATGQLGRKIRMAVRGYVGQEFLNDLKAKLGVGIFPAAELQGDLHLHVLAKEVDRMADLHPKVMGVDLWAKLDFLNLVGVLMLFGFLVPLGLLVSELAEIHEPANWGRRVRRD